MLDRPQSPSPAGAPSGAPLPPLPDGHPEVARGKVGVLLLNLGTPDGTDYWSMRRYLKQFLSDRRVIEVNPILWKFLLNVIILTTRPSKSGEAYAKIWDTETNESPLRKITRAQSDAMADRLTAKDGRLVVDWAMRYGQPSVEDKLLALKEQGCERVLLVALYPQYAAATTATAYDAAFDALKKMRWQPALRTAPPYHDHPAYIDGLAKTLKAHLAGLDWEPEKILCSFHGLPKSYFLAGDPYHCHCAKTTRLLREALGGDERLMMTFQSRFGREEWLQPYTDDTIEKLAKEDGVKRMVVLTPGFSADCVETLEEIGIGSREVFEEAGGEKFSVVPCLNDGPESLDLIEQLVANELAGWVDLS